MAKRTILEVRAIALSEEDNIRLWEAYFEYARTEGYEKLKWEALREIKRQCVKQAPHAAENAYKWVLLRRKCLLLEAPYFFESFLLFIEMDREPDKRFYLPRIKALRPIVMLLQALEDDMLDLLSISMPPGTGKSTLGIFYLCWIMLRHPNKCNLASAHADTLTRSFYDGVLGVLTDPEYLVKEVFPNYRITEKNSKDEYIHLGSANRFKSLTCRAIGAGLTGSTRCEKLLYVDDLCQGIEEAMSIERLDKLWALYTANLKTRKKSGCKELHIATRWSVHDVIGRLEQQHRDNPRAVFYKLSALNEYGKSNFEYAYGVGFTTADFLEHKEALDEATYRALYDNEPIERDGLLYDEQRLQRFFSVPKFADDSTPIEPEATIAICDTKTTGKDFFFMPIAQKFPLGWYIVDCVCTQANYEIAMDMAANKLIQWNVQMCQFESNAAGTTLADKVNEKVQARGGITSITKKLTKTNKQTKIIVNSPWVIDNCLFLHRGEYLPNSDYDNMMKQLTRHSAIAKNKNDDVPDGMACLALFVQSMLGNKVEIFKRMY